MTTFDVSPWFASFQLRSEFRVAVDDAPSGVGCAMTIRSAWFEGSRKVETGSLAKSAAEGIASAFVPATTNRRGVPSGIEGSCAMWNRTLKFPAAPPTVAPVSFTGDTLALAPTRPVTSQTSGAFVVRPVTWISASPSGQSNVSVSPEAWKLRLYRISAKSRMTWFMYSDDP